MPPSDIRQHPYWHDRLDALPELTHALPAKVDVLVVGAGYTGLSAAIECARAGRSTLVIDARDPGFGCSTRNGGQVSTSIKPSLDRLAARHGEAKARAIRDEGAAALSWIAEFVESEGIDCDFRQVGRFHAAHTPRHYEMLVRDGEAMRRREGIECHAVPRSAQRTELGTDLYHGGLVHPRHCSVDPARLHRGYLRLALDAGASVTGHCAAQSVERTGGGFRVRTTSGIVTARDVVVATNGYTGPLLPWLRRRVIPIGSYIIATEELPRSLVDEMFPTDRVASDTCKVIYYYRASPDRRRILFGGRVSSTETRAEDSAPRLYAAMCRVFPQLEGYGVSHAWSGTVAYSFDELPHTGVRDGIHYAMNYCGSGVSLSGYLGMRTGQKILGRTEGRTAFDDIPHPTRPLYSGRPWFLPATVAYYRWKDEREFQAAKAATGA